LIAVHGLYQAPRRIPRILPEKFAAKQAELVELDLGARGAKGVLTVRAQGEKSLGAIGRIALKS
jgi:hypothetical protein